MTIGLTRWWSERTGRERILLAVLAGLIGAMLLWYGVIRPAASLAERARESRAAAARDLADVLLMTSRLSSAPTRKAEGVPVDQILRSEAEAAGITLASVQAEGNAASAAIDAVRSGPFFAWVANLRQRRGLFVTRLAARPNADATLSISVRFQRAR